MKVIIDRMYGAGGWYAFFDCYDSDPRRHGEIVSEVGQCWSKKEAIDRAKAFGYEINPICIID